jgi:phosphodiesterase/alkaline phosphatase D-like protein
MTFTALPAPPPSITGQAASNLGPTEATLEAEINPNRWATVSTFEYGPGTTYGESTEISSVIGQDQFFHPVEEEITGLEPGSVYHFRVVAINFTGTAYGPDQTFATPGPPSVNLATAGSIGESSARLSASVNPNSSPTGVRFEYGPTTAYGSTTATLAAGSGSAPQSVSADVGGLAAGTTYHFRVVAQNENGAATGSDQIFTTLPSTAAPPIAPAPAGCRKGFVRRNGKCVRQRCKRGFAKRRGKCVKKPKNRKSKSNRRAKDRNG